MNRLHANQWERIVALAIAALAAICCLATMAFADAQGWNGPGWHVSGSALPAAQPPAAADYILFEGPHTSQSDCVAVYDRLYSPVGVCRFLTAKPGE